jgi:cell division protein FtsX
LSFGRTASTEGYEFCCVLDSGDSFQNSPGNKAHLLKLVPGETMRNFLGFLVIVVLVVLAAGYYLGWFTFSTANTGNTTNVNMQINKDKIETDAEKAKQKVQETAKDIGHKIKNGSESGKENNSNP